MDGNLVGLVAVIMTLGIPLGGMYTYYRVRKLRTEERLAAIARGVNVPSAALGYSITFALVARIEPDAWVAASFGIIPLAVGAGFFLDSALVRRDARA